MSNLTDLRIFPVKIRFFTVIKILCHGATCLIIIIIITIIIISVEVSILGFISDFSIFYKRNDISIARHCPCANVIRNVVQNSNNIIMSKWYCRSIVVKLYTYVSNSLSTFANHLHTGAVNLMV